MEQISKNDINQNIDSREKELIREIFFVFEETEYIIQPHNWMTSVRILDILQKIWNVKIIARENVNDEIDISIKK